MDNPFTYRVVQPGKFVSGVLYNADEIVSFLDDWLETKGRFSKMAVVTYRFGEAVGFTDAVDYYMDGE